MKEIIGSNVYFMPLNSSTQDHSNDIKKIERVKPSKNSFAKDLALRWTFNHELLHGSNRIK